MKKLGYVAGNCIFIHAYTTVLLEKAGIRVRILHGKLKEKEKTESQDKETLALLVDDKYFLKISSKIYVNLWEKKDKNSDVTIEGQTIISKKNNIIYHFTIINPYLPKEEKDIFEDFKKEYEFFQRNIDGEVNDLFNAHSKYYETTGKKEILHPYRYEIVLLNKIGDALQKENTFKLKNNKDAFYDNWLKVLSSWWNVADNNEKKKIIEIYQRTQYLHGKFDFYFMIFGLYYYSIINIIVQFNINFTFYLTNSFV